MLVAPALVAVAGIAIFPLGWTVWESIHLHDLRMPWRGQPFVGLANYGQALGEPRFWDAIAHTVLFTASSVALELIGGMALALTLNRVYRGRGLVRAAALIPWAIPTVVAALLWQFMFDGESGVANLALTAVGIVDHPVSWFAGAVTSWIPIVLADVWKATPFVALLLLAGLQNIDDSLYEAARMDGAGGWRQFTHVTVPMLAPALLVALMFRTLDAFRVFDLIYVMSGGGPGTATEPIALYTYTVLLQHLRFGYGSALAVMVFVATLMLAVLYVRVLDVGLQEGTE